MKTPCCNYPIDDARPVVMWNPGNQVVQCHNCGHVYEPKSYPNHLEALKKIASYPVHSEPVGGAMTMQDIATDALRGEPV